MNCAHHGAPRRGPSCLEPEKPLPELQVGSLVTATHATAVCDQGERGVVYERYELDGRPGWSVIFESGRHDGFSPDEVNRFLVNDGQTCDTLTHYVFTNVRALTRDFDTGVFAPAFGLPTRTIVSRWHQR